MKPISSRGIFIAFEGLDGSGSSTQASLLHKSLIGLGYKSVETKEPTNNIIGGLIRGQLTHVWKSNMETLQLLFAADRGHHLEQKIIPALEKKHIVITDRYFLSSIAYGSIEADINWLKQINCKFVSPDITFLLKVPANVVMKRMTNTRDQLELFEEENKLKKVWKAYQEMATQYPNIIVIDGQQEIGKISELILGHIRALLEKRKIERSV